MLTAKGTRAANVARGLKKTAGSTGDRRRESNNGADHGPGQRREDRRGPGERQARRQHKCRRVGQEATGKRRATDRRRRNHWAGEGGGEEGREEGREEGEKEGERQRNAKAPSPVERAKERAEVRQRKGPKRSKDTDEPVNAKKTMGEGKAGQTTTRRQDAESAKEHEKNRSQ